MFRMPVQVRNHLSSALAVALMAGGLAVSSSVVTTVEAAAQAKPKYSKGFVKVYEPVAAIVNAEGADYASAKAQIPAVVAAVENADDRHAAGSMTLVLGNKLSDSTLQRQGLELMLASGKVPAEQVGHFNFFVGNLAYGAKDYAAARTALEAAIAAGHTADNPQGLIAESFFAEDRTAEGLAYLKKTVQAQAATGAAVPEQWLRRGLKMAYEGDLAAETLDWSNMLVKANPTKENWQQALQVVAVSFDLTDQEQLDMLRLMMATGSISTRNEFTSYIETLDPRIMPNESGRVLQAAVTAGVMTKDDQYYGEVDRVVQGRLAAQPKEAADYAREAAGAAVGRPAESAGDIYFSMGEYAKAEEMYQLAVQKGTADAGQTLTRLGMAQAMQGKGALAQETLGKVTGSRVPVATMWSTFAATKG